MSSVTNPTSSRKPFDCLIDRQKACRQAAELPRTIHTYSGIFSLIQQESYVKSRNRNISVFIEVIYCCCPLKQHFEVMKPTGKHFETMRKNTFSIYTIGYGVERINEGGTQLARSCNKLKSQRAEPSISFFQFPKFFVLFPLLEDFKRIFISREFRCAVLFFGAGSSYIDNSILAAVAE